MVKKKISKNKLLKIILPTILVIALISFLFLTFGGQKESFDHWDGEQLYKVTISDRQPLTQSFFQQTTAEVGERVTLTESGLDILTCSFDMTRVRTINFYIQKNGNTIKTIDMIHNLATKDNARCLQGSSISTSFVPQSEGRYDGRLIVEYYMFQDGWYCVNDQKVQKGGTSYYCPNHGSKTVDGIQICKYNKCNVESDSTTYAPTGRNVLTVENEETCDKPTYEYTNWETTQNIDGGRILERERLKINDDCEYDYHSTETETQCDSGYIRDGNNCILDCDDEWYCDDWSSCNSNIQSRYCDTDCGDLGNKPVEERFCECSEGEEKCEGTILLECKRSGFDYSWENLGVQSGKCGVGCIEDSECSASDDRQVCKGGNAYSITYQAICISDSCQETETETLLENCNFGCNLGNCLDQPPECNTDSDCGYCEGCFSNECREKEDCGILPPLDPDTNWLFFLIPIGIFLLIVFLIVGFIIKKRKK